MTATVEDWEGQPIKGKLVHFTVGEQFDDLDGDGYNTPGVDSLLNDLNGNGRFDAGVDELGEEIIENGEWDALGTIDSVAVADADGFATVTYRAAETPGSVVVKVSAGGWSLDAPIELLEYDGTVSQISQISFQALPPELYVSGVGYDDQAVLEARCYLVAGQAAPAGIAVTFTLLSGPGEVTIEDDTDAAEVLTDSEGIARAVNDVLNIDLLTSSAYRQNSGIDIASSVPRGAMTSFDVTIKDRYGNPLGGHLLAISASGGLVTASGTTDQWGAAGSLMFWAPADSGDVVITVVDNDPGYGGISLSQTVTVN